VIVICPRCRARLRIDKEKFISEGLLFKCPQCGKFFVTKKPLSIPEKVTIQGKILVAHSNPAIINEIISLLTQNGYQTIVSFDGIDAILKVIKELPLLTIIEGDLPKINGFEVCRRIRSKAETKGLDFLFIIPGYGKKYREHLSKCGDSNYIEDYRISELLIERVSSIKSTRTAPFNS
jgi:predicted Zn finger-like uncharacterized protein